MRGVRAKVTTILVSTKPRQAVGLQYSPTKYRGEFEYPKAETYAKFQKSTTVLVGSIVYIHIRTHFSQISVAGR